MGISDEIKKNLKTPSNSVNNNTIESVAKDIFKRAGIVLVSEAKNGRVKTSKGLFSNNKYVTCIISVEIDKKNAQSGHPRPYSFEGDFSHWCVHDNIDIQRILTVLKRLCAPEGIKVTYTIGGTYYPSGYDFTYYLK